MSDMLWFKMLYISGILVMSMVFFSGCQSASVKQQRDVYIQKESPIDDNEFEPSKKLPTSVRNDVQFYPQAPFGNWDLPYQEACEEASVIIAMNYIRQKNMSRAEFDAEILKLVEYQKEVYGDYLHTDVKQTVGIIKNFYEYDNVLIIESPKIVDIKTHLANGGIILSPLAGQKIGNPYYSGYGPMYHFLVIHGYSQTEFITSDVGTKRGDGFRYPYADIIDNIYDYAEPIEDGVPRIIVVQKP